MPKAHPLELRQAATAHAKGHGVQAAAKHFGVSGGTISKWCKADGVEIVSTERTRARCEAASLRWEERRVNLANDLGALAAESLDAIRANITLKPRSASDLARVLAVAIDKAQLLTGGQTARHGVEGDREGVLHGARTESLRLVG